MFRRLLLVCLVVLMTGCVMEKANEIWPSSNEEPEEIFYVQNETPLFETSAANKVLASLSTGSEVGVLEVVNGMARTDGGWIAFKDLEKERSHFQLTVKAPAGATVKILNIKPKYHDGIWLKKGKYHIGVYPKGKAATNRWISLDKDRVVPMDGSRESKTVSLTVRAPSATAIKVLNIGPKYHDEIRLKPGKYHVAAYHGKKRYYDQWISVVDDTVVTVPDTQVANNSRVQTDVPAAPVAEKSEEVPASSQSADVQTSVEPSPQVKTEEEKKPLAASAAEDVDKGGAGAKSPKSADVETSVASSPQASKKPEEKSSAAPIAPTAPQPGAMTYAFDLNAYKVGDQLDKYGTMVVGFQKKTKRKAIRAQKHIGPYFVLNKELTNPCSIEFSSYDTNKVELTLVGKSSQVSISWTYFLVINGKQGARVGKSGKWNNYKVVVDGDTGSFLWKGKTMATFSTAGLGNVRQVHFSMSNQSYLAGIKLKSSKPITDTMGLVLYPHNKTHKQVVDVAKYGIGDALKGGNVGKVVEAKYLKNKVLKPLDKQCRLRFTDGLQKPCVVSYKSIYQPIITVNIESVLNTYSFRPNSSYSLFFNDNSVKCEGFPMDSNWNLYQYAILDHSIIFYVNKVKIHTFPIQDLSDLRLIEVITKQAPLTDVMVESGIDCDVDDIVISPAKSNGNNAKAVNGKNATTSRTSKNNTQAEQKKFLSVLMERLKEARDITPKLPLPTPQIYKYK